MLEIIKKLLGSNTASCSDEKIDTSFPVDEGANSYNNFIHVITDAVNSSIKSRKIAEKFIYEEMDAASNGDAIAVEFVNKSGISRNKFEGAISKIDPEVDEDEVENVECIFRSYTFRIPDQNLRTLISLNVVDNIMKIWKIGKYELY